MSLRRAFAARYSQGVIFDENSYALDDDGNRVLVGLTAEETQEFFDLTDLLASTNPGQPLSSIDWTLPNEARWLALMKKYAIAREVKH